MTRLPFHLLLALAVAACGGPDEDDADFDLDDEGTIEAGLNDTYDYRCNAPLDQAMWQTPVIAWVRVQPEEITFSRTPDLANPLKGLRDPAYTRQPTKVQYDRFNTPTGFPPPDSVTLLKTMRAGTGAFRVGGGGGYVSMAYFRDGGPLGYASYFCKRVEALLGEGDSATVRADGVTWPAAEAAGMVRVANEVGRTQLHSDVGLSTTQAGNLVARRPFANLGEVAAVTGIGAATLRRLRSYALAQGWVGSTTAPGPVPAVPSAKAQQYLGFYSGTGTLKSLALRRDGWFMGKLGTSNVPYLGTLASIADGGSGQLPTFQLRDTDGTTFTVAVKDRLGTISVVRAGRTETLRATGSVESREACVGTEGTWRGTTTSDGVACTCPAGKVLIWAYGGCVR